ncbi:MAG: hypothetical protein HY291_14960 [Planctomycetes bacterium]|nr:hypothetical protein [Planctomycetota bacterium]
MTANKELERPSNADQADKLIVAGKLACGLAHDLNNLLTVIMGRAQMGQAASPDPKLNALFSQIADASDKAAAQVRQILVLARQDDLKRVRFDVSVLAGNISDNARALLGPRQEFRAHVTHGPTFMMADPVQVEQILLNLLQHAREHLGENGAVELDAQPMDVEAEAAARHAGARPGRFVRLAVRLVDPHGSEEKMSYEPFVSSRKRGSGMALTVVDHLARQHEGFLEVTGSARNRTAAVYLPLGTAGKEQDARA